MAVKKITIINCKNKTFEVSDRKPLLQELRAQGACMQICRYVYTHTYIYINTYIPTGEGEQELRAEGAAAGPGLPVGR